MPKLSPMAEKSTDVPLSHWGYDYFYKDNQEKHLTGLEDIMETPMLPESTPDNKHCDYDYCSEKSDPYKSEEDLMKVPVLEGHLRTVARLLVKAAEYLEKTPNSGEGKATPVPGGILPVDGGEDAAQMVHTLTINDQGFGVLRSPKGTERPLTASDIQLFMQYFLDLGKVLKTMKPVSGK